MPALRSDAASGFAHEAGRHRRRARDRRRRVHHLRRERGERPPPHRRPAPARRPAAAARVRPRARRGPAGRGTHRVSAAAGARLAGRSRRGSLGRRGHGAGGARGRDQLGLRAGGRPRRAAREPDRADPRLRCRSPAGRHLRAALDRGLPGAPARSPAPSTIPATGAPPWIPTSRCRWWTSAASSASRHRPACRSPSPSECGVASIMTAHVAYPALDPLGPAGHALPHITGRAPRSRSASTAWW